MEKKLSKLQKDLLGIIYKEYKSYQRLASLTNSREVGVPYYPQRWFYFDLYGLKEIQIRYLEEIAGLKFDHGHGDIYLNKYIRRATRESKSWYADIPLYTPAVAASFSRAIKRLEERGLIVRCSEKDIHENNREKSRRNNYIILTKNGYAEAEIQAMKKEMNVAVLNS